MIQWRKSSFSESDNCVEVAVSDGSIAVRNSNRPQDGMITFTRDEMSAWIKGCQAGEFDDLV